MGDSVNDETLSEWMEGFKNSAANGLGSEENKKWRKEAEDYRAKYSADFLKGASSDEIFGFIKGLYSFQSHYTKGGDDGIKKIIVSNLEQVKNSLIPLIECNHGSASSAWDVARSNETLKAIGIGTACVSEILMIMHPDDFALFNGRSNPGFEALGFGYHRSFKDGNEYLAVCDSLKAFLPRLQALNPEIKDLFDLELFAQYVTTLATPDGLAISEFEQKYRGQPYRKGDPACKDIKSEGQRALKEIKKLRDEIKEKLNLVEDCDAKWQNSGNIIPVYFRFKRPDHKSSPISIAMYIDKTEPNAKHGKYVIDYQVKRNDVPEGKGDEIYGQFFKGFREFPKIGNGLAYNVYTNDGNWERIDENSQTSLTLDDLKAENNHDANIGVEIRGDGVTNEELRDRIEDAVEALLHYYDLAFEEPSSPSSWEEAMAKYNPGITKERWLELLNNKDIVGPLWGGLLAAFYSFENGATCLQVGQKYGRDWNSVRSMATQLATRVQKETGCPSFEFNGEKKIWPILFTGRDPEKGEPGKFVWKLRPELREALEVFDIMRLEWKTKESHPLKEEQKDGLLSYNTIFYGVPGCGKSYHVKKLLEGMAEEQIFRVTFYPDYSNADFVGQILPKLTEQKEVFFDFEAGPFSKAMKEAEEHPELDVALIIEEINRGNAAAIFGDIFQILDRKEDGTSEYPITNSSIAKAVYGNESRKVSLPSNLYLIATMNTSDQNVFPLDTAFKRRWNMECIPNGKADFGDSYYVPLVDENNKRISWNAFKDRINGIIEKNQNGINSADKKIGAYFVLKDDLLSSPDETVAGDQVKAKRFAAKIFQYLYGDVFPMNRSQIFKIASLEDLLSRFASGTSVPWADVFFESFDL